MSPPYCKMKRTPKMSNDRMSYKELKEFEDAAVAAYREKIKEQVREREADMTHDPDDDCRWFLSLLDQKIV